MNIPDYPVVVSFASGVLTPIILHFLKTYSEKRKDNNKDKIKEEIEISSVIYDKLESLKEEYKADRVWIEQFHNGGHFYPTGKSIQKFSMFYEAVSPHADSIKLQFQNIPISLFSRSINELLEKDIISIPDFNDSSIHNFGLKYIAEENETQSAYMFSVRTIDGKFIGILGVDYINKHELSQEDLKYLLVEASSIGGVLINHLKK
jgi:hypothetical protein